MHHSSYPLRCSLLMIAATPLRRIREDSLTWGWCLQWHHLTLVAPSEAFERRAQCVLFDCFVSPKLRRGVRFGMHVRWLFSAEQTRINPFTCNPAKLPCGQALHSKCTISYPCLVSMQHFWDIEPGGNTQRMASATPHSTSSLFILRLLSRSPLLFLFPLHFSLSFLSILRWTGTRESGGRRICSRVFIEASFTAVCVLAAA